MAKHTETSWKEENPTTQLSNSVDKVTRTLEQATSHPGQQLIQQAENAMGHAENALNSVLVSEETQEPLLRNRQQLDQDQEQLQELHAIVDKQQE